MTRYAPAERQALCDTLLAVGPEAPTLCHPWRACELTAHLILRETRPDLVAGQWVKPLRGRLDRAIQERATAPYAELVATLRGGPPRWALTSLAQFDEATNLLEFFVHHEDVRRAAPGWAARELDPGHETALWDYLQKSARFLFRRATAGVVLDAGEARRFVARPPGALGSALVEGPVGELVLYSNGRRSVASVSLTGPTEAVQSLASTDLSI
ncbi:MAG: TIGR03085 family metal-binding protein [Dermatophilaceae bacterium]